MQVPLVAVAPIVEQHAQAFRDLFENRCQYDHFQNYVTGLMVLENKSLPNISRCVVDSADKTNLSRFFSQAPWEAKEVNDRRVEYMVEQTQGKRRGVKESSLVFDDTLCEHVGSLFEYVARHFDHCENRYPLGHNLETSHFVSGAVRFPIDMRLYRRYEDPADWGNTVKKHFPGREIPTKAKERKQLHKEVDAVLLTDEAFRQRHEAFQNQD